MRRNLRIANKMEQVAQLLKFYERDRGLVGDAVTDEKCMKALTIAREDFLFSAEDVTRKAANRAAAD